MITEKEIWDTWKRDLKLTSAIFGAGGLAIGFLLGFAACAITGAMS